MNLAKLFKISGVFVVVVIILVAVATRQTQLVEIKPDQNQGVYQNNDSVASSTEVYDINIDPNVKIEYSTSTLSLCGKEIKVYPTIYLKNIEIWSEFAKLAKFFPKTNICSNLSTNYASGYIENKLKKNPYNDDVYELPNSFYINTSKNSVWTDSIDGGKYLYPWGSEIETYKDENEIIKKVKNPIALNFCGKTFTYPETIFIKNVDILKRIEEIANKMPKVTEIKISNQIHKDICTTVQENATSSVLNISLEQVGGPWYFDLRINNRLVGISLPENVINDYGYEWYIPLGPLDKNKECASCRSVKETY